MSAGLVIEVLARDGEVLSRHRVERLPLRVGRALDSDVIVDDPYVAPLHLVIEADGEAGAVARDAGSRNGTFVLHGERAFWRRRGGGERRGRIALDARTTLRIGHTLLRIRPIGEPVAPEMEDTFSHSWEGSPLATTALAAVIAVAIVSTWYGNTDGAEALQTIRTAFALVGGAALWAGLWAVFNRIFAGRLRYGRHLFITACALAASFVWEELSEVVAYALSFAGAANFNSIGAFAIVAVAVLHHLRTIRPQAPRFARNMAITLMFSMVAFSLVQNQIAHRRFADDLYLSALKPPALRLAAERQSEAFFDAARQLKLRADAERSERPADDGEAD